MQVNNNRAAVAEGPAGLHDADDDYVSPLQGIVGPVGTEHNPAALQALLEGQAERLAAMRVAWQQEREFYVCCRWAQFIVVLVPVWRFAVWVVGE